jgi:hypothetical protein
MKCCRYCSVQYRMLGRDQPECSWKLNSQSCYLQSCLRPGSRIAFTALGLVAKFCLRRRESNNSLYFSRHFSILTPSTHSNNNLTTTLLIFSLYLFRPLLIDLERLFLTSLASVFGFAKVDSKISNLHLSTPANDFPTVFSANTSHDHPNFKTLVRSATTILDSSELIVSILSPALGLTCW